MDLNIILCILALSMTLTEAQSYRYRYSRRRSSRPASRLFGSSHRSRHDSSRRPASRPFTIPGFETAFGSPTPSSKTFQSNLGFNLGFGGPAFVDPIAGMYDNMNVGDLGGIGQGSMARINDFASLNPAAANTRSSFSRESNTAMDPSLFNSRQQHGGNNMGPFLSPGSQGANVGFGGTQDSIQFLTTSGGNTGGYTALDLTPGASNQQIDLANFQAQLGGVVPSQNPLMAASQLNRMSSVQFIDASGLGGDGMGIDLASLGPSSAGIQAALNRFDMAAGSGMVDSNNLHGILAGQHKGLQSQMEMEAAQLGLSNNQLDFGANSLGLGGAQLGLDNQQLGLDQNNVLLDSNSLSNSLGLNENHVIIQSEAMDLPNLGQASLSAGNQILLDSSGSDMSILGNQLGLGNGQSLLNSNQIGSELSQLTGELNAAASLQGQMMGVSGRDGGSTKIITAAGDFSGSSLGQSQDMGQMTSQINGGLLTQLAGA